MCWLAALLLAAALAPLHAQDLVGRVMLNGRGIGGVPVTLHRVTRDTSAAVLRATSGSDGAFRFSPPAPAASGFTVLFATAEWRGVRYFGAPLHPADARDGYRVQVFDTASGAPVGHALRLARRDLILLPNAGNGWEVNEVLAIDNPGQRTIIAKDGLPAFQFRIPSAAAGFEVGDAALPGTEVRKMGNRVLVLSALRPGTHEMVVRYRIPRSERSIRVPVAPSTLSMSVLIGPGAPRIEVEGLAPAEPRTLAGETFQRFAAARLDSGTTVTVRWRDPSQPPVSPVIAAAGLAGLVLVGGATAAVRNTRRRPG